MLRLSEHLQLITAVMLRHALTWRKMWLGSSFTNFINPALFLYAFGFGMGSLLATMQGVSYLSYIVPGMAAYAILFSANFDTTINAFSRFKIQRTYDAMLATPVRLPHIILGEILWAALKAVLAGTAVMLVGVAFGGVVDLSGILMAIPAFLLGALAIGGVGMLLTSFAKQYDFFSYIFTIWVTPNFLFTGVFFEIDRYPAIIQWIGQLMPVYHMVEAARPALVGLEQDWLIWLGHMGYLAAMALITSVWATKRFNKRLFD